MLCINSLNEETGKPEITLKSGMTGNQDVLATFNFDLLSSARCPEHNEDKYGISNPENSVFNTLEIQFNGKRVLQTGSENGTVKIGAVTFYYKK